MKKMEEGGKGQEGRGSTSGVGASAPGRRQAADGRPPKAPVCGRFPEVPFCGCTIPCRIAMREVQLYKVLSGLFLGPIQAAYKVEMLKEAGITHILDLAGMSYAKQHEHFKYLSIDVDDDSRADLARHFKTTNAFIDEALDGGGAVLVHCQACISRSPSVVVAYLLNKNRTGEPPMDVDSALALVRAVRSQARPNDGFLQQLRLYHADLSSPHRHLHD